jgi:hypothetical protein
MALACLWHTEWTGGGNQSTLRNDNPHATGSRCDCLERRSKRPVTAALGSVRLVGVGPASYCGGGHDRWGCWSGLCLLGKCAALSSVRSIGVVSASHCRGGHGGWGRCYGRLSFVRRGLRQPLCWRAQKVLGADLASVRSIGVGQATHCGGGHDIWRLCSGLCSLCRRGLSQPLCWLARQWRALLWNLFVCLAWDRPATVVAGMNF